MSTECVTDAASLPGQIQLRIPPSSLRWEASTSDWDCPPLSPGEPAACWAQSPLRVHADGLPMHRLRTCAARLRPLTASQAAQTVGQQRPAPVASTGGPRTFQPLRGYSAPVASEPFLNGTSSNYVEEMYYAWLENPKSVHKVRWCWWGCGRAWLLREQQQPSPTLPRKNQSWCI